MNPQSSPANTATKNSRPQIALITGGAKRIGAHIARRMHLAGYDVAVHCNRSIDAAEALCRELNGVRAESAKVFQANLAEQAQCEALAKSYLEWRPYLDSLINNASVFERTPFGSVTQSQLLAQQAGNFNAAFLVSQSLLPALRLSAHGSIINICDARWDKPLPGFSAYAGAKAAMVALTRCLSVELAPAIRVNAVGPGSLDWPENQTFSAAEQTQLQHSIPLQRIGNGDDIADAVLYLDRPQSYVTGQIINVDGGISAVSV